MEIRNEKHSLAKIEWDVMLSDFAKVLNHLSTLIDELTSEICVKEDIEWEI